MYIPPVLTNFHFHHHCHHAPDSQIIIQSFTCAGFSSAGISVMTNLRGETFDQLLAMISISPSTPHLDPPEAFT